MDNSIMNEEPMRRRYKVAVKKPSKIKHSLETTILPSFVKKSSVKGKRCPPGTRSKCTCVAKRKLKGKAFSRKRCSKGYHYNKTTGTCEPPSRFESPKQESTQTYDTIMDKFKNI